MPFFNRRAVEDYQLWRIRLKTALIGKDELEVITEPKVEPEATKRALLSIIALLGDNPLQAVQKCSLIEGMPDRHQERYTARTAINMLASINNVLNERNIQK